MRPTDTGGLVPAFPKKLGDGAMPCWIIFLRQKKEKLGEEGGEKRKSQTTALCPAGLLFWGLGFRV